MRILAVLSPTSYAQFVAIAPPTATCKRASVSDARHAVADEVGWHVIVDPGEISEHALIDLIADVETNGARAIIYASLTPATTATLALVWRSADCPLVLRDSDGAQHLLASILHAELPTKCLVVRHMWSRLEPLAVPLKVALVGLFSGATVPNTVQEFNRRLGIRRTSAQQRLARARLRPPREFLVAARLCDARDLLTQGRMTQDAIALHVGFSIRGMSNASCRFTGLPPGHAASTLTAEQFATRVARHLERPPKDVPAILE